MKKNRVKILKDLVEEYKERKVNYSTYEFDELSYRTLILDIHTVLKENQKLKEQLKIKHDGFMASVNESCEYAEENQK